MRARWLFLVSLTAIGAFHLCYGLKRLTLGIDFTDEGAYLSWPLRMLFGEKPFTAELGTLLRPLVAYLYVVFRIHPAITLYEFRLLGWLVHLLSFGLLSTYLFRLSRAPLQSPLIASVPFFICHIFGLASPSYNSLSSDFFLMALCLRGLASTEGSGWPTTLNVASGLTLFIATLAHPVLGVVAAVMLLHEIFCGDLAQNAFRRRLTPSNVGILVFATCWALFVVYLVSIDAHTAWLQRVSLFQSITATAVKGSPLRFYVLLAGYPFLFSRSAAAFSLSALTLAGVLLFSVRAQNAPRSALAAATLSLLLLISLISGFSYDPGHLPIAFAQAALVLLGVHGLRLTPALPSSASPPRLLLAMSGFGALLYATVTYYFSPLRSWMSGILALPFAFSTGLTLLMGAKPGRFTALFNTLATAMLALLVACVARGHYRFVYRDAEPGELRATFRVPKLRHIYSTDERVRAVDALYDHLHPKLARGEPLLVFDSCPMLYFLFDAMPAYGLTWAARYSQSPAALAQLNRELNAKPLPRYAIRALVDVSDSVWKNAPLISYENYPLNETVVSRYELERTIFPFEIWHLKSGETATPGKKASAVPSPP